jgi:predicted CoA-binding protein
MKPSIAVIGAGNDRRKFGNKAVRAYLRRGYDVFPVHPREETVEGLPAYRSVLDVPGEKLDRVSIYLPPALGLAVLDEVARRPVGEVWLNPGADAPEVVDKAKRLGLNVVTGCSIINIGEMPDE